MLSLEACSKSSSTYKRNTQHRLHASQVLKGIICRIFKPNFYDEYTNILSLISEKKVVIVNIVMV